MRSLTRMAGTSSVEKAEFFIGQIERSRSKLTKAKCWEYEQEWRVLHKRAEFLYGYERESLTGVYFGAAMPESQMRMVASILEAADTKLYKVRISKSSFKLVAEPPTFKSIDYRKVPPLMSSN